MEDWEKLIRESTDAKWKADKFIKNLKDHKAKYPGFIIERVARHFARQNYKDQGWMCYQPIQSFTKSLRGWPNDDPQ